MKYKTQQDLITLLDKKFKRNVYGLSEWTDIVEDCWFVYNVDIFKNTSSQHVMIKGSKWVYPLSELKILT